MEADIRDERPLPEEVALKQEKVRLLYRSLDVLTLDQRSVLIARFIENLTIAETAEMLGWTESKVKTTQHRAIKAVKGFMVKQLEREGGQG